MHHEMMFINCVHNEKLLPSVKAKTNSMLHYLHKVLDHEDMYINGANQFNSTYLACSYPGIETHPLMCDFPPELFVSRKTQMGMCHTFHPQSYIDKNKGEALKCTRAGTNGGLSIIMNVLQDEYMLGGRSAGVKVSSLKENSSLFN